MQQIFVRGVQIRARLGIDLPWPVGQGGAASKVLLSSLDEAEYDEDQSERELLLPPARKALLADTLSTTDRTDGQAVALVLTPASAATLLPYVQYQHMAPSPLRSLSPEDIHTMSICQRNLFVPKYWQSSSLRRNHFSQFARTNPFWMGQADGRNQACKAEDRMLSVVCRQLHSVEIRNENKVELDLT